VCGGLVLDDPALMVKAWSGLAAGAGRGETID
jgi:hypothetical protein